MIRQQDLVKRMEAQIQIGSDRLTMKPETAVFVVRLLAPYLMDIIREEIAEARREWNAREVQR